MVIKTLFLVFILIIPTMLMSSPVYWVPHIIGDLYTCWQIFPIDFDQDGDMDVLGTSTWGADEVTTDSDGEVAWWENSGNNINFTQHYFTQTFKGASDVWAGDFDGDLDYDMVAVSLDSGMSWWENDGSMGFTRHILETGHKIYDLSVIDLDEDGDLDLIIANRSVLTDTADIIWYEQDSLPTYFTEHAITSTWAGAESIFPIDLDGDGDIDLVACSHSRGEVGWGENDGLENFTLHILESSADSARKVWGGDIDGDGDNDILSTAQWDGDIIYFINTDGAGTFAKHYINGSPMDAPWDIMGGDIDGDGDIDIAVTDYGPFSLLGNDTTAIDVGDKIFWFEKVDTFYYPHIVVTEFNGAKSVKIIDFDYDGDLDIVGSACWEHQIWWFEQRQKPPYSTWMRRR